MKRSQRLVSILLRQEICLLKLQVNCEHEWEQYAGYRCVKCGFITGANEKITTQIEKDFPIKPPKPYLHQSQRKTHEWVWTGKMWILYLKTGAYTGATK